MTEGTSSVKPSQVAAARLKVAIADRQGEAVPQWLRELASRDLGRGATDTKIAQGAVSEPLSPRTTDVSEPRERLARPGPGQESASRQGTVGQAMTRVLVAIQPTQTLQEAATLLSLSRQRAGIVADPKVGVGLLTERDILDSIGAGQDLTVETVADHLTRELVFADPEWSLSRAALSMAQGNFRHLVVIQGTGVVGLLSMSDIVRVWRPSTAEGAQTAQRQASGSGA
jgi:CBS domain-containing protein